MVRPKILIVQHSANMDGSTISGLLLVEGLLKHGWEVAVVLGFQGPAKGHFEKLSARVEVIYHKNWLRRAGFVRSAKDIVMEVIGHRKFMPFLREINPDVVYANSLVSLSAVVAARRTGVQVVWHIRELFADVGGEMYVHPYLKGLVPRLIRNLANQIVVNSQAVAKNVVGRNVRVHIVPNAVGQSHFDHDGNTTTSRRYFKLPEATVILGVPGTLRPMKGHPFFFRAIAPLLIANRDWMVIVSGDGSESYVLGLHRLVNSLRIADQVKFLGRVDDMRHFYQSCNIVVVPSRAEPFGRVIIEAFANRVPVVATGVGGIREIITDGRNGILISYKDNEQLQSAARDLLNNRGLADKIVEQAYADVKQFYTAEVYQQRIILIIERSL